MSPLTTSFAETSAPLCDILGPALSLSMFKRAICGFFQKLYLNKIIITDKFIIFFSELEIDAAKFVLVPVLMISLMLILVYQKVNLVIEASSNYFSYFII